MQLEISRRGHPLLIAINGRLDTMTAPELDLYVKNELSQENGEVVLDLHGLDYISSAGLRALLGLAKLVEGNGGKVAICGLRGEVQKVFELSGFTRVFTICARPTA
ncbi:MAG: STAS domain-containing protein [Thermodesulfobacteriota bacterium]